MKQIIFFLEGESPTFNVYKYKNVQPKFKVEYAFKQLTAAEDNSIVKIREKTFLSSMKKMFFYDATRKTRTNLRNFNLQTQPLNPVAADSKSATLSGNLTNLKHI